MPPRQPEPNGGSRFRAIGRALRYRNYRLFFAGQIISLIGTWLQQVAMAWLIYSLTHSAFALGLVGFAGQLPALVVTPFAGIVVDRANRHRMIIATQSLAMLQAFVLAALTLTGHIAIWHIVALSVLLGFVNAFDMPARQAFVVEMVERREDLGNAIALNSSMFNAARLVGPSVAGLLIAAVGEGVCFLLNGISYIAVILALLAMRVPRRQAVGQVNSALEDLREGFRYVFGFAPVWSVIALLGLISLVGMPYTILMPAFASDVLHGGPSTLGFLMAATGVGALGGALYLAARRTVLGLGRLIPWAAAVFGAGLCILYFASTLWVALLLMLVTGVGMMIQMASSNTIIQTIVPDERRGRVMSIYMMAFVGTAPIGSLAAGYLATRIGVSATFAVGGVLCLMAALYFGRKLPALREMVRPIYIQMGILPEEAMGVRCSETLAVHDEEREAA